MRALLTTGILAAVVLALPLAGAGGAVPDSKITEFPLPRPDSRPYTITPGPDGNVWFTEELGNAIVRLVPGDPPTMTAFPDPTDGALPWDINPGPDGKLWFTELVGRHVSKISVSGNITQYTIPGDYGIDGIA